MASSINFSHQVTSVVKEEASTSGLVREKLETYTHEIVTDITGPGFESPSPDPGSVGNVLAGRPAGADIGPPISAMKEELVNENQLKRFKELAGILKS